MALRITCLYRGSCTCWFKSIAELKMLVLVNQRCGGAVSGEDGMKWGGRKLGLGHWILKDRASTMCIYRFMKLF